MMRPLMVSFLLAGCAIALILAAGTMSSNGQSSDTTRSPERMTVLCAAGFSPMMDTLKTAFESHAPYTIDVTYRGSAELVALYEIQQSGDLLIAADVAYHQPLIAKGLCGAAEIIGDQFPCLLIRSAIARSSHRGKKLGATSDDFSLAHWLSGGYRTSIPKRAHAAIARAVAKRVGDSQYDAYLKAATVSRENVSQVAGDVDQGFVDVGIGWNTTAAAFEQIETIHVDAWKDARSSIGVSRLSTSTAGQATEALMAFLESAQGQQIIADFGYAPSVPAMEPTP